MIWLAGSTLFLQNGARVGFHGVYKMDVDENGTIAKGAKPRPSNEGNAKAGAYLAMLGVKYDAISAMVAADPDHMLWLNNEDTANKLGIKVTTF